MTVEGLRLVFERVNDVLVSGGRLVFDLNTVEAVGSGHTDTLVAEDHIAIHPHGIRSADEGADLRGIHLPIAGRPLETERCPAAPAMPRRRGGP